MIHFNCKKDKSNINVKINLDQITLITTWKDWIITYSNINFVIVMVDFVGWFFKAIVEQLQEIK